MLKDEVPYVAHEEIEHRCYLAGYFNPVMHKWSFVIDGVDSGIKTGECVKFMGLNLKVTFSLRREAISTKMFSNVSGVETYFEAWQSDE